MGALGGRPELWMESHSGLRPWRELPKRWREQEAGIRVPGRSTGRCRSVGPTGGEEAAEGGRVRWGMWPGPWSTSSQAASVLCPRRTAALALDRAGSRCVRVWAGYWANLCCQLQLGSRPEGPAQRGPPTVVHLLPAGGRPPAPHARLVQVGEGPCRRGPGGPGLPPSGPPGAAQALLGLRPLPTPSPEARRYPHQPTASRRWHTSSGRR